MFDRALREPKARLLAPVAQRLTAVPATAVTMAGLALGLGAAALAAAGWYAAAVAAWLANRLADGLDGEVARHRGATSDRGGYVDLVADATVYAAVPIGFAVGRDDGVVWVATAVLLATFYVNIVTVTMLSAVLEKRAAGAAARGEPTTVTLPSGLVEGTETIVFVTVLLAVPALAVWWLGLMAVAVAVTAVARTVGAWRRLAPDDHRPATAGQRR
ncbi:MAG: CDP-alcohol phosphatidyltransferase family protein [Acidimicrobiales bacterium]